ncbi:MAG: stage II sporulation protein R [Clostridiales bacterium]|nr:stage II sporulation protein R [Eubacteriales bacterium]MDH7566456.1 stage II sporulation protein R [Clostridiales bacterium]
MSKGLTAFKEFGRGLRKGAFVKTAAVLVLVVFFITAAYFVSYSENVNKDLAGSLVRLHVVANSDSSEDQALKRDVRDRILQYMKGQLQNSKNAEEAKAVLNNHLNEIEKLARQEIDRYGKDYTVKAVLGNFPFPTKSYGDVTLPAGNYQALRVVIGKGEGANWWCVLFPPLCFVDATHGTIPDSVKQGLKKNLTEEEYRIITSADSDEDIPIRIKFKVVELFEDSKIRFTGMISKLFK